jgi:hypothetical protein
MLKLTMHKEEKPGKTVFINPDHIVVMIPDNYTYRYATQGNPSSAEKTDRVTHLHVIGFATVRVTETPEEIVAMIRQA